jgi:putative ABC transport system permease protein
MWDTLKLVYGMFYALQGFFIVAGTVTLLVGAVGVMNIMLVVVGERTAEIGLRKALGARGRDIFLQFLLEALAVAGLAGGLGVAGGLLALRATAPAFAAAGIVIPTTPDPLTTLAVTAALVLVAVVAGVAPALRAARTPPAEALRAY